MRLAIPHWQNQVSPVLDVADTLVLVGLDQGSIIDRQNIRIENGNARTLAHSLAAADVDVLICGAISRPYEDALIREGIEVIAQTCGEIEQVLGAFLKDRLQHESCLMPGCSGHRRRRHCRQQNKPRH
ncbi:NifB/NifX family molybdenum-iron cluster-binding protein [Teredinibacter haidensis]|uniref:NifB/NifX family molybdenum-iron cluster-binding protein n=1 Tax=Teredinibacter haidensis TaxID=2731755 RepID=UPI000948BCA0|nr:NifB/NifX family molybdenum-iron cluster-binding protein [Teredinibacter haidensis]